MKTLTVSLQATLLAIPGGLAFGIKAAAHLLVPECTFILLDPTLPDTAGTGRHGGGMLTLFSPLNNNPGKLNW